MSIENLKGRFFHEPDCLQLMSHQRRSKSSGNEDFDHNQLEVKNLGFLVCKGGDYKEVTRKKKKVRDRKLQKDLVLVLVLVLVVGGIFCYI